MIRLHNDVVSADDEVIVVGDVATDPLWLPATARFNGKKTLIRGNHDRKFSDAELAPFFHTIIDEGEGIELEEAGHLLYATHYPTSGRTDRFNLVGHIHTAWKVQLNALNVGVDTNHFRPTPLTQVPFFITACTEFYDGDCWAAYHPSNATWHGKRGKSTSYIDQL